METVKQKGQQWVNPAEEVGRGMAVARLDVVYTAIGLKWKERPYRNVSGAKAVLQIYFILNYFSLLV